MVSIAVIFTVGRLNVTLRHQTVRRQPIHRRAGVTGRQGPISAPPQGAQAGEAVAQRAMIDAVDQAGLLTPMIAL